MKVGSAVLGIHIAVLCVFSLTQGCVTTESEGSGRGAGARRKGPWKHEYKAKSSPETMAVSPGASGFGDQQGMGSIYEPVIFDTPITPDPRSFPSTSTETYIVRKGDILSKLAVEFDTTTAELVRLNNLSNPDVLYVGQELRVPAGRGGAAKSSTSSKPSASVKKGGSYTIQKGDTLSGIAVAAGVSINDLRSLNNIQGDKIMAGEILFIPSGGKVPTTTKTATTAKKPEPPKTTTKPGPVAADLAPTTVVPVVEPSVDTNTVSGDIMVEEKMLYPGETLDDVARQYGVSKAVIMRMNNITDETQVKENQRLRIPIAD